MHLFTYNLSAACDKVCPNIYQTKMVRENLWFAAVENGAAVVVKWANEKDPRG